MKIAVSLIALSALVLGSASAGDWDSGKRAVPLTFSKNEGNCLSYDFVDLNYGIFSYGTPYLYEGDFYGASFSKSLGSFLYFTADYYRGSHEFFELCGCGPIGLDTDRLRFGLGAHRSIAKCIDLTFEGGADYIDASYERKTHYNYDSWGYYVGPGIRARAGRFEMFAKALYTGREGDFEQGLMARQSSAGLGLSHNGWVFNPGFLYHFTETLAFQFAAEVGEVDTALTFGARYHY